MKDWQALHNGVLFWLARPPIRGQVVRQVTSTTALTVRDRQLWWGKELTEPPQGRVASMHRHMGPNARFHLAPCRVWRGAAGQGVRTVCLPRMSAPDLRPVDRRRRPNGAGRPSEFIARTRPVEVGVPPDVSQPSGCKAMGIAGSSVRGLELRAVSGGRPGTSLPVHVPALGVRGPGVFACRICRTGRVGPGARSCGGLRGHATRH